MKGLRSRESKNFLKWFTEIQVLAKQMGAVYFLDSGEGHDLITEAIDIGDLSGWLIPEELAPEFERLWVERKDVDNDLYGKPWGDYYTFVEWTQDEDGTIHTFFKKYDENGNELTI